MEPQPQPQTDYMGTPEELAKQPQALEAFHLIAGQSPDVFNALWSFWNFAHAWDDLLDGSGWPDDKKAMAMKALHDFTVDLLLNPFIRSHAAELRGLLVMALTRAMDGDRFERSDDPAKRALAPAVRCGDVDVIMGMAYLAGGWDKLRALSPFREYDRPDHPPGDNTKGP